MWSSESKTQYKTPVQTQMENMKYEYTTLRQGLVASARQSQVKYKYKNYEKYICTKYTNEKYKMKNKYKRLMRGLTAVGAR